MALKAENDTFVQMAKAQFHEEGHIEIDNNAAVSVSPDGDGAYVQAWVWVALDDAIDDPN